MKTIVKGQVNYCVVFVAIIVMKSMMMYKFKYWAWSKKYEIKTEVTQPNKKLIFQIYYMVLNNLSYNLIGL